MKTVAGSSSCRVNSGTYWPATEMRIRKGLPGFEKWKTTNCEQEVAIHTLTVLHWGVIKIPVIIQWFWRKHLSLILLMILLLPFSLFFPFFSPIILFDPTSLITYCEKAEFAKYWHRITPFFFSFNSTNWGQYCFQAKPTRKVTEGNSALKIWNSYASETELLKFEETDNIT